MSVAAAERLQLLEFGGIEPLVRESPAQAREHRRLLGGAAVLAALGGLVRRGTLLPLVQPITALEKSPKIPAPSRTHGEKTRPSHPG